MCLWRNLPKTHQWSCPPAGELCFTGVGPKSQFFNFISSTRWGIRIYPVLFLWVFRLFFCCCFSLCQYIWNISSEKQNSKLKHYCISKINLFSLYNYQSKTFWLHFVNDLFFLVNEVLVSCLLLSSSSTLFLICSPRPFPFIKLLHSTISLNYYEASVWNLCLASMWLGSSVVLQ